VTESEALLSKNSKEETALPKGRLRDQSLYLKVLQLYFAGYPSAFISRELEMTLPTVNRTLKKFRHALVRQLRVLDYLKVIAGDVKYSHYPIHEWFFRTVVQTQSDQKLDISPALQTCFSDCPLCPNPRKFRFDHLNVHHVPDRFPYPSNPELMPDFGHAGILELLGKKGNCRHCPFGPGARNLAMAFAEVPEIYLDLQYYFSYQRIRDVSEYYFHLLAAIVISLVRRIVQQWGHKAEKRGIGYHATTEIETRTQVRLVSKIYDILQEPVGDHIDGFGSFVFSSRISPVSTK